MEDPRRSRYGTSPTRHSETVSGACTTIAAATLGEDGEHTVLSARWAALSGAAFSCTSRSAVRRAETVIGLTLAQSALGRRGLGRGMG